MFLKERKRNLTAQILALILSFLLVFNPLLAVRLVYAAEEATEAPAVEETTDLPAKTENIIETGDAEAQSGAETNVNDNTTEVPGEVTTDPCQPADGCPGVTTVENENEAGVDSDSGAAANTGKNEIINSQGDALIGTGDATASAESESQVNTNTTVLVNETFQNSEENLGGQVEETDEVEGASETDKAGDKISLVMVDNDNIATVSAEATASANTGENQANGNSGAATIQTGDAYAQADSVNLVNTNLTGSDFEYLVADDSNLESNDFLAIWQSLWREEANGFHLADGVSLSIFSVENDNFASLVNQTTASANTGENRANNNEGSATIQTGGAYALANAFNLVNTNITGSNFLVVVINIYKELIGDLIFPSQDYFLPEDFQEKGEIDSAGNSGGSSGNLILVGNENQAEVDSQTTAIANTGQNETNDGGGDATIQTGDAFAQANSLAMVNTNVFQHGFFTLIINNFGSWLGQVLNWLAPGLSENPQGGTQIYQFEKDGLLSENSPNFDGSSPGVVSVNNQNSAEVKNTASASADSGSNQANNNQGDSTIQTGDAVAIANSTSIVNSNFFGSGFLLGIVNIFGSWIGNLFFAYPNLTIEITDNRDEINPGEVLEYVINYSNDGQAPAEHVALHQTLPSSLNLLSVNSPQPEMGTQTFDWEIGTLEAGESGKITIRMEVDPAIPAENSPLVTTAQIGGNGAEENNEDNFSADETRVVFADQDNEDEAKEDSDAYYGTPILSVSSWNNVNEFVYLGDTVLFEITVENQGEGSAYEAKLYNELFNEIPGSLGNAEVELGEIKPGEQVIISFGLSLSEEAELGEYRLFSWVKGSDGDGEEVSSNEATSDFEVKAKGIASLFEARAMEKKEILGAILGDNCSDEDLLPYVLLFLLSSLWLVDKSKGIFKIRLESWKK